MDRFAASTMGRPNRATVTGRLAGGRDAGHHEDTPSLHGGFADTGIRKAKADQVSVFGPGRRHQARRAGARRANTLSTVSASSAISTAPWTM